MRSGCRISSSERSQRATVFRATPRASASAAWLKCSRNRCSRKSVASMNPSPAPLCVTCRARESESSRVDERLVLRDGSVAGAKIAPNVRQAIVAGALPWMERGRSAIHD
jgi:hypothetical protein